MPAARIVETVPSEDRESAIDSQTSRHFSAIALELHRRCRTLSRSEFLELSWRILSDRIAFDAACWLRGHEANPAQAAAHASGCTGKLVAHYLELSSRNTPCGDDISQVARTLRLDYQESAGCAAFAGFAERWRLRYALLARVRQPVAALTSDIVLWRDPARQPFDDSERTLLNALSLHLTETDCLNRLAHLARWAGGCEREARQAHTCAIADRLGFLRVAPPGFQKLLLQEFPDWGGRRLPQQLAQGLGTVGQACHLRFIGAKIFARIVRTGDTFLIQGREKHVLDGLTPRELEVARLSAQGFGYRDIAQRLGIAPATARNHLNTVLIKSGTSKRSRIAAELAELE